jgi:error-prone DNA polymerase
MVYAELHCVSNFTFLRGASHPQELVRTASALGYRALAITDECSAQDCNLQLIVGSEFHLEGQRLIALVSNRQSYAELSALITTARRRSSKGEYQLEWTDLSGNLPSTLLIWLPSGDLEPDHEVGERLSYWFKERLWIGV